MCWIKLAACLSDFQCKSPIVYRIVSYRQWVNTRQLMHQRIAYSSSISSSSDNNNNRNSNNSNDGDLVYYLHMGGAIPVDKPNIEPSRRRTARAMQLAGVECV